QVFWIIQLGSACKEEDLGHLLAVQIFCYGKIGWGTHRPNDRKNTIALHQLSRLLNRLRRCESVIERYKRHLTAIDAAGRVDLSQIGRFHSAETAQRRDRPTVWHSLADLDFGVGYAGGVLLVLPGSRRKAEN